nr:MAG TPA: hypothetical protein [Caudoviricetes sp.]
MRHKRTHKHPSSNRVLFLYPKNSIQSKRHLQK